MLFPGAAIGKEASAVFAYAQETSPVAENHVFYDVSRKGKDDAINKTRAACEAHAKQQRAGKYQCDVAGTCFEAGWFSIASYLKSGGRIGISCKQVTQEEAINTAKSACGSGYCARIFTY